MDLKLIDQSIEAVKMNEIIKEIAELYFAGGDLQEILRVFKEYMV